MLLTTFSFFFLGHFFTAIIQKEKRKIELLLVRSGGRRSGKEKNFKNR